MRILIVMAGFFPGKKYGGPPVSIDNFCTLLKDYAECFIVTKNHDLGETKAYENINSSWNDRGNARVLYLQDNEYRVETFERIINEIHPTIMYLQGLFQECVFPCLRLAKKYRIKVLLAPRGELCAGAFTKKYKKIPYIFALRFLKLLDENVEFQSTSEEETASIRKYLGCDIKKIHYLTNIPSIPSEEHGSMSKKKGCGHFVFISRIVDKKNLLSAINYFNNIKGSAVFDIYGPIQDSDYWHECEKQIKKLPSYVSVNYKGVIDHNDVHKVFSQYDSFLFPTYSENYGHVIAEALNSGCIPIISDQTPWTDMYDEGAGYAFPLEKVELFVHAIQEIIDMDDVVLCAKKEQIMNYIRSKQNIREIRQQYYNVLYNLEK